jgi:hypothetical protein
MKRPREMTEQELNALPIGPMEEEFTPHTADDLANGATGIGRVRVIMRETLPTFYEPDDWICWRDAAGRAWTFGQFKDGAWFKQAAPHLA